MSARKRARRKILSVSIVSVAALGIQASLADPSWVLDPYAPGVRWVTSHPEVLDGSMTASPPPERVGANAALWNQFDQYYRPNQFWSRLSCDEVFSTTPPEIVTQLLGSQISAGAQWRPVCGHWSLVLAKYNGLHDPAQIATHYSSDVLRRDDCGRSSDRYADTYVAPPTPAEPPEPNLAKAEVYQALIDQQKGSVARTCCGNDDECVHEVNKAKLMVCGRDVDQAHCSKGVSGGISYTDRRALKAYLVRKLGCPECDPRKIIRGQFPTAIPAVFVDTSDDFTFENRDRIIPHELSHVCSWTRTWLDARRGNQFYMNRLYASLIGPNSRRTLCEITRTDRAYYREQFSRLGFNKDSIRCFFNLAAGARLTRFPPMRECTSGCPGRYLEEGLGQLMGMIYSSETNVDRHTFLTCTFQRDGRHPLESDLFACALMTPRFRQRQERVFGCRL